MRRLREVAAFGGNRQGESKENQTMFEGFEWYTPTNGSHWKRLQRVMPTLKAIGIDNIWVPPGCKAGWVKSNGYDTYDLYDLGEFDQKGSRRTKWGTKEELVNMMSTAQALDIGIYWDAVLNHKAAADYTEHCSAIKVHDKDRTKEIGQTHQVEVWTGYDFPGRGDRYSNMKYHWQHFSGTNYNARTKSADTIYKFVGKNKPGWASDVDDEDGNADYLMFNDLDFAQKDVYDDTINWGIWISRQLGLAGFRLDAVKHFSESFLKAWIAALDQNLDKKLFMVGEYWRGDTNILGRMIERFKGRLHLFDVVLVGNFNDLSRSRNGDMSKILKGTLVDRYPNQAVTFVTNHDTQERFDRDHEVAPVEPWFHPLAYAFILLRSTGHPTVFYGDVYGTQGTRPKPPTCNSRLPILILVRKLYAYGDQTDYLDDKNCIGFTRHGHLSRSGGAGLAVVMSNATTYRSKKMYVGKSHIGEEYTDILRFAWGGVIIDQKGWGTFPVGPRSVGVWTNKDATGREEVENLVFDENIYNQESGSREQK